MTIYTLGRKAFEAFWKERGKTRGCDIREWGQVTREIQDAWEAAALCVQSTLEKISEYSQLEARARRGRPRQGGMRNEFTKPPKHYNAHPSGVECIEVTRHLCFNLGNVVKYIWRAGLKERETEIRDLEKALDYLHDEIIKRKLALGAEDRPDGRGHQ